MSDNKVAGRNKLFAPNLVVIGIDNKYDGDYQGRIWDQYHLEAQKFRNSMELLRRVDAFLDDLDFPQRSTLPRSFAGKAVPEESKFGNRKERQMVMKDLEGKNGNMGTFIVQVKYRQNATWQGQVVWAEQNRKVYFRSALELMKLIDSAIDEGELKDGADAQDPREAQA